MYAYMYMHICIHTRIYTSNHERHPHICRRMCVCVYLHTCEYIHMHMYICVYTSSVHTHAHVQNVFSYYRMCSRTVGTSSVHTHAHVHTRMHLKSCAMSFLLFRRSIPDAVSSSTDARFACLRSACACVHVSVHMCPHVHVCVCVCARARVLEK